ncbi:DotU family type IV/VI secretion system protein [Caballeronia mineralivorans]|nr:DotU family type IV/VI secretion system protein [Caballeronia mineralivorans]
MRLAHCWMPVVERVRTELSAASTEAGTLAAAIPAMLDSAQTNARRVGYSEREIGDALFAVIAWIDEQAMTRAWPGAPAWRLAPLQRRYFSTTRAGVEFFQRAEALPPEAHGVREVYGLMLIAGFEGRFSSRPKAELTAFRNGLLEALSNAATAPLSARGPLFPIPPAATPGSWRPSNRRSMLPPVLAITVPLVVLATLYVLYDGLLDPLVNALLTGH